MKRKGFIFSILHTTAGALLLPQLPAFTQDVPPATKKIVPAYLQPGDTIGICCPSGNLLREDVDNCIQWLKTWGWKVKLGNTVGDKWYHLGGTDENRLADMQRLLDDPEVKAILFGKGGYGYMRIMDAVNWEKFRKSPKWLIGFSDITALHMQVKAEMGMPSIHSIMANSFKDFENESMYSLKKALQGQLIDYRFLAAPNNRPGKASGELVGGNLSLVIALQGSSSQIQTNGKILFLEDVGEYIYSLDRMLWNLKRSGKLEGLAGLLLGGFTKIRDKPDEDPDRPLEEIVLEKVAEYDYPVAFNFPAGHQAQNMALKMGMNYELTVADPICELKEV